MSRINRSNSSVRLSRWACSPSLARKVAKPLARRPFSRKEPMRGSSSAIRILAIGRSFAGSSLPRQHHGEGRSLAETTLELDAPAVRLGDGLHDREAEPTSAIAEVGARAAREPFENECLVGDRDTGAGVAHPDTHLVIA